MKVTKAIIPAAGLGTRVLPASKSIPKEMIPLVDKPAIQYIVEEAAASGITDILIVTARGKNAIADHFDRSPALEAHLDTPDRRGLREEMVAISSLANLVYIRQQEMRGLGHAVLCARRFVADDPFVVMYGDDVIRGPVPAARELCAIYERTGCPVVGVKEVPLDQIGRYGAIEYKLDDAGNMHVTRMVEKPRPDEAPSRYAILGRVVLTPDIFSLLERTDPGANGEIQLTDAMNALARQRRVLAAEYSGTRFDIGDKLGIIEATLYEALHRPELRGETLALLQDIVGGKARWDE